jgi:hypothetical protein
MQRYQSDEERGMDDTPDTPQHAPEDIEMRFEPLPVGPELPLNGLTPFGAPIAGAAAKRLAEGIRGLLELPWDVWPATIAVTQISISTEPIAVPTPWRPPEVTWARVSIVGLGWAPNVPVITKWNNAFGFPDNGEGANSIKLQSPVPDANGRFGFQTVHRGVAREASEWLWEANRQLVLVARQGEPGSPEYRYAHQRYLPPHVLWQWVPNGPVLTT